MIIPAYNEAGNISTVLNDTTDVCRAITDDYEVIIVGIAWRAVRLHKRIRQVEVDHYPRTSGTPASITPGFLIRLPFRFLGFAWRCWRIRSG